MFGVKHNECVGFESKWKVKKVSANTASQTTEFSVSEKGSSTTEHKTQEVQTITQESPSHPDVDMEKLAEWLNKIYPSVKDQIDKANSSRAFRNYRLTDKPVDTVCKLVQSVIVSSKGEGGGKAMPIISCLQWNNTGKFLAVSYNFRHKTWCHHTGVVCIYALNRDDTFAGTPKKRLSTESCITSVKYHPHLGSMLAAGTFTGHIYIWDTENDVDTLVCSIVAHDEYITQIAWIQGVDPAKTTNLATSSTDGYLKLWSFSSTENNLFLKSIYKIKTPIFGKINHTTEISKTLADKVDLGVVGFDFSKHIPEMFVVAMEGGLIVRCSMLGVTKIKVNNLNSDVPVYDPVFKYHDSHKGEIVAVKFALHRKDMFLTCGTDGEIRVYMTDQDEPAQVIFTKSPLNDVSYVWHEEKLLAACGQNGNLEVFHLITGKPIGLNFNEKVAKRNLTSMAINNFKTNYVIVGTDNGEMQLWNVPWQSIELQSRK